MAIPFGLMKVAVLSVLRNEDSFLLLKRAQAPNKGLFTPAGGKLDPHESPLQAVRRETREEVGIDISEDLWSYKGTLVENSPTTYNWISFVYEANTELITPPECREGVFAWIHKDELREIPTPPTDYHLYQYLVAGQGFSIHASYDEQLSLLSLSEALSATDLLGQ